MRRLKDISVETTCTASTLLLKQKNKAERTSGLTTGKTKPLQNEGVCLRYIAGIMETSASASASGTPNFRVGIVIWNDSAIKEPTTLELCRKVKICDD